MYCRNCGESIAENVEICLKCNTINGEGVDYCPNCGSCTTEKTQFCRKCGAKLIKVLSTAQMQKEVVSKGKQMLGNIILVIGYILLFAMVANLFASCSSNAGSYSAMSSMRAAIRCAFLGGFFWGIGKRIKRR